jgi:hypothetical protein
VLNLEAFGSYKIIYIWFPGRQFSRSDFVGGQLAFGADNRLTLPSLEAPFCEGFPQIASPCGQVRRTRPRRALPARALQQSLLRFPCVVLFAVDTGMVF